MPQDGRLQPPGTPAALPPGERTPQHVVCRTWGSKSSDASSEPPNQFREQQVSFGPSTQTPGLPVFQRVLVSGPEWGDSGHHLFSARTALSYPSGFYFSHPPWVTLTSNTQRTLRTKIPKILCGLFYLMSYLTVNKTCLLTVSV